MKYFLIYLNIKKNGKNHILIIIENIINKRYYINFNTNSKIY